MISGAFGREGSRVLLLLLLLVHGAGVSAESTQSTFPVDWYENPARLNHETQSNDVGISISDRMSFAKRVERYAAQRGARAFLLARMGREESELPDDIRFTHVGIAIYSTIETADGEKVQGYAIYNLYQGEVESDRSSLVQDFPVDFFAGVPVLKTAVMIPKPELQRRLMRAHVEGVFERMHNPFYSAVSNPFTDQYQNCTEYVLDVVNAALYQAHDKDLIKRINRTYFKPQRLNVSPLKMLFGAIFMRDVTLRDHPDGRVRLATYTTLRNYLQSNGLLQEATEMTFEKLGSE